MKNEKWTTDEHYVPEVLLRGFTSQYVPCSAKEDVAYRLWRYDLALGVQKQVSVNDICFRKNLYEFFTDHGEITERNYLEKCFGRLETAFGKYRTQLERKAFTTANYRSRCFLNNKEKHFWMAFIVIQMLRNPETLKDATKKCAEFTKQPISDRVARNLALYHCFSIFTEPTEDSMERNLFANLVWSMRNLGFLVLVDNEERLITSERALYVRGLETQNGEIECERVLFPVTAKICLVLQKKQKGYLSNIVLPINDKQRKNVLYWLSREGHKVVYSKHKFDEVELSIIHGNKIP